MAWSVLQRVFFLFCLTDDTLERREEEEEKENVQNRHIAGAEKKQEGDGV